MARVVDILEDERRRDRRRPILLDARLERHAVKLLDISLGGVGGVFDIASAGWDRHYTADAVLSLHLERSLAEDITFKVQMVRFDAKTGAFGVRFCDLSDEQFRVLQRLTLGRPI